MTPGNPDNTAGNRDPKIIRLVQSLSPSGRTRSMRGIHQGLKAHFPTSLWVLEEPRFDSVTQADRFFPHANRFSFGLIRQLAKALKAAKPDLVHTHGTLAHFYGLLAARWARVPHRVATIHRGDESQEENFRQRFRNHIVFGRAERVVFMTDIRRRQFSRVYGGPASRWETIPVGVELDEFLKVPVLGVVQRKPAVILCTGHLRPERDHETLFRAFARVVAEHGNATLQLAGKGEAARGSALKNLALELDIADKVVFLGLRRDIPRLLDQANIFVHPARHDNLPRSVIEASAAARPVIATNVGGIPEAVDDGKTGVLVPPNDPESMAEALAELIGNPARSAEMGRAGREYVSGRFSYDRMIQEYRVLYEKLLTGSGG